MSYYLLQKTNVGVLSPVISQRPMRNMTSTSVVLMCKNVQRELVNMCIYDGIVSYSDIIQFVNPYEYVFAACPNTDQSVSTLTPKSNSFYELTELFYLIDMNIPHTSCLLISDHPSDILNCIKRQYPLTKINTDAASRYGFIFYEVKHSVNLEIYVSEMIQSLMTLLKSQSDNGTAIIKVNYLFHRPILDVVYILSSMYEKVYIVKPNVSNAMSHDKYIVCLNKIPNDELYTINYEILLSKINKRLYSLVDNNLPLTFVNKINDVNVVLGQRQLEYLDQALTIMSSANKYELINGAVSKNMQKSASMCEKLGLPYVKTNMFLEKR